MSVHLVSDMNRKTVSDYAPEDAALAQQLADEALARQLADQFAAEEAASSPAPASPAPRARKKNAIRLF